MILQCFSVHYMFKINQYGEEFLWFSLLRCRTKIESKDVAKYCLPYIMSTFHHKGLVSIGT